MCGRYTQLMSWRELVERYRDFLDGLGTPLNLPARYNLAPSQTAPVVLADGGRRVLAEARWGLVPHWAKDIKIGYKTINARAETVHKTPAFRGAFKSRRCLLPASGFYEWTGPKARRQPFYITRADGQAMTFAGLWESWHDKEAERPLLSFTIITTEANAFMARLHNRMPVILGQADFGAWLNPAANDGRTLLKPCPDDWLAARPVSARVNKPANDDPGIIETVELGA